MDNTIKVGDKVTIVDSGEVYLTYKDWVMTNIKNMRGWLQGVIPDAGITGIVTHIEPHEEDQDTLAYVKTVDGYYVMSINGLKLVPQPLPLVSPKKTSGRKPGGTNRQFDVKFKKGVVRYMQALRESGNHGDMKDYLKRKKITYQHAAYWTKQFNEGHFSPERAICFSRKSTMIHG